MCFVPGIRNSPLSGNGAKPVVNYRLSSAPHLRARAAYRDSRTAGLAPLPEIKTLNAFLAVDAVELGIPASTIQVFLGENTCDHSGVIGRKINENIRGKLT